MLSGDDDVLHGGSPDFAEGTIPSTRPVRSLSGDAARLGHGSAGWKPRGSGVGAGSLGTGQHGPAGVGGCGQETGTGLGLSVEGGASRITGRDPSGHAQTDPHPAMSGPWNHPGSRGSTTPNCPCLLISCRAGSARVRQTHWIDRSTPRCSISTSGHVARRAARSRSPWPRRLTPEARTRRWLMKRSRCSPKNSASPSPN